MRTRPQSLHAVVKARRPSFLKSLILNILPRENLSWDPLAGYFGPLYKSVAVSPAANNPYQGTSFNLLSEFRLFMLKQSRLKISDIFGHGKLAVGECGAAKLLYPGLPTQPLVISA